MAVDHGELRLEGVPALPVFRAFVGLLGLCIDGCWDVRRIGAAHPHPLRGSPRQRGQVAAYGSAVCGFDGNFIGADNSATWMSVQYGPQ